MINHIPIEIHTVRPWDQQPTCWYGTLTTAVLGGTLGLPVVRLSGSRRTDDGVLDGELRDPRNCPPLTLVWPCTDAERVLLTHALAQGYRLDTTSEYR